MNTPDNERSERKSAPSSEINADPNYAETDRSESLPERRGQAYNLFPAIMIGLPVLLAIIAFIAFSGMKGAQTAQGIDKEVTLKPTPMPSLAPPVNDSRAASQP